MHDVLFIDEILDDILQHFTIHEDDINAKHRVWKLRLCRRTLAYLARTCKVISSPALDRLWERQSTLMPVLKLLPTFQMIGKGRYAFVSPIEPNHWGKFLQYSRRIHTFTFSADGRLLPSVYEHLFAQRESPPLFPSLHQMIWSRNCPLDANALCGFLSPSLRIADLQSFGVDNSVPTLEEKKHVLELLTTLQATASHLETLKIGILLSPSAEVTITKLASVRKLDLSMTGSWRGSDTFVALGNLENLVELHVLVTELHLSNSPQPSAFPRLESLYLWGAPVTIGPVLKVVSSKRLRTLHIKAAHSYSLNEWGDCLFQLPSHLTVSLREFKLECLRGLRSLSDRPEAITLVTGPIMACRKLEKLYIDLEGPLSASDDDVEQMVSAWAQLREFRLWFHKVGDGPTLLSLAKCAASCKNLADLELPIDAQTVTLSADLHEQCHSLRWLALLGNAQINAEHAQSIGRQIFWYFPNLVKLDVYAWSTKDNDAWSVAKKNIPSLETQRPEYSPSR